MSPLSPTITVQLKPELTSGEREALTTLTRELGVSLRAMHPDTDDSVLRTYFTVDVTNAASAERVVARLRESPAIAAAYVKPPEAMP